jgi:hypothetical protein
MPCPTGATPMAYDVEPTYKESAWFFFHWSKGLDIQSPKARQRRVHGMLARSSVCSLGSQLREIQAKNTSTQISGLIGAECLMPKAEKAYDLPARHSE